MKLSISGSILDSTAPIGRLLFIVLAMVADFESDPNRAREGVQIARAKGRLRGKPPKLNRSQNAPRRMT
ncbi:hypothetical protein NicSoilB8_34900 [Arthrobacter sp. NicSoilB8]|nr:hypothetical protein NicSoilB8_34900 [Arthrobacter sp. NicSoilB8]